MRYGLLALSLAMLTGGGLAAQSALAISDSAQAMVAQAPDAMQERTAGYGALPYAARTSAVR